MTYRCLECFDSYQMQYYEELCDYFKGRMHLLERLQAFLEEAVAHDEDIMNECKPKFDAMGIKSRFFDIFTFYDAD